MAQYEGLDVLRGLIAKESSPSLTVPESLRGETDFDVSGT